MAKPRGINQKAKWRAHSIRLTRYADRVQSVYDTLNREIAKMVLRTDYDGSAPFRFSDYPSTKKKFDEVRTQFVNDMRSVIYSGTSEEWRQSNLVQDLLADKALKFYGVKRRGKKARVYYQTNNDALKAFQRRKDDGLTLSQKLWNQSSGYKEEMEFCISSAIEKGTSAVKLSKRLSKYLSDFPSLKKDYKEKYGKTVTCHDCEYRSIRLARSEINMAYRTAEQERWKQFDFVLGYEVKLTQNGHHVPDICDELAGKYPKDFVFKGWHPNCMCYVIPILKTEEQFFNDEDASDIVEPPKNFTDWLEKNAERIDNAAENNSLPYWYTDNEKYVKSSWGGVDYTRVERYFSEEEKKKWSTSTDKVFKVKYDESLARASEEVSKGRMGSLWSPAGEEMAVDISRLHATQNGINAKNVISLAEDISKNGITDLPTAIKVGNEYYLLDGHHRIAAEIIAGKNEVNLRVVKVPKSDFAEALPKGFDYDSYIRNLSMERRGLFVMTDDVQEELTVRKFNKKHRPTNDDYNSGPMAGFDILSFDKKVDEIMSDTGIKYIKRLTESDEISDLFRLSYESIDEDFTMTRYFRFEEMGDKKLPVVTHNLFEIPEELQGKGLSKKLFAAMFEQYENAGIKRVYIHANMTVGGICWGKYGFMAEKSSIINVIEDRFAKKSITEAEYKIAKGYVERFEEYVPMQDLAYSDFGERLLKGSSWHGIIDLDNAAQVEYLHNYLSMSK